MSTSGDALVEYNFDGIVGPTHNHGGLSPGNLASLEHAGEVSNPREAALQGLAKMRFVKGLGVGQAVLPPGERPNTRALRALGFAGSGARVLEQASAAGGHLLQLCSSSSAMWTANAATVAPSRDTEDGRLHLTVANLSTMFHRSLEAEETSRILARIFRDPRYFAVHPALPCSPAFSDEGAANHSRLATSTATLHLFGWGRSHFTPSAQQPTLHPARQTLEASQAVARLSKLPESSCLFWQQSPRGIDDGAFHTDVLGVGTGDFLFLHEHAFVKPLELLAEVRSRLGDEFRFRLVTQSELPAAEAVSAYPFNSQLLRLPTGELALIAPEQSRQHRRTKQLLEALANEDNPVKELHFSDVTGSMKNGGGPACLRSRIALTAHERAAIQPRIFADDDLLTELEWWVKRHYRDRLRLADLADPQLLVEVREALDELTRTLRLGSVYDFQGSGEFSQGT